MASTPSTRIRVISQAHGIQEFERGALPPALAGQKSLGISRLPPVWVPAFFCLAPDVLFQSSANSSYSVLDVPVNVRNMVNECADAVGWDANTPVHIRSSAVGEDLSQRGEYLSRACTVAKAFDAIREICEDAISRPSPSVLALLVQQSVSPSALHGHLSNERRLSRESRDWIIEYFEPAHVHGVVESFSVRGIAKTATRTHASLDCPYHDRIAAVLRHPAAWATRGRQRMHFEWVWDQHKVWIVQADIATEITTGRNPTDTPTLSKHSPRRLASKTLFRGLDPQKHAAFRKLRNAIEYQQAGLPTVSFWIVQDADVVRQLVAGESVPELERDAAAAAATPLVMRTDIAEAALQDTQMLPRSDTLRTPAAVLTAMRDAAGKLVKICRDPDRIGFIFHRYLPAVSAAFCYATPDERRVRIESVWGFADGLSYFSHDTFEVDCGRPRVGENPSEAQSHFRLREKIRYKAQMLAYDSSGKWVVEGVAPPWDWKRSITYQKWIYDIAYFTKRFAQYQNRRVNMMWFVGVDGTQVTRRLLPWYHEEADILRSVAKAPESRRIVAQYPVIRQLEDIERLIAQPELFGKRVTSVRLDPAPDLIRDRDFAARVAKLSKIHGIHIELAGGILSHTFYMLKQAGAVVECVDPFESPEESESFGKLVRDRIPDRIADSGEFVAQYRLDGEQLIRALKSKLIEEALEAASAPGRAALIEEIADVHEVIAALCKRLEIDSGAIEDVRRKKREQRGGFDDGRILIATKNPRLRQATDEPELFLEETVSSTGRRASLQPIEVNRNEVDANRAWLEVPIVPSMDSDGSAKTGVLLADAALNVTIRRIGKNLRVEIEAGPHNEQLSLFGVNSAAPTVVPTGNARNTNPPRHASDISSPWRKRRTSPSERDL